MPTATELHARRKPLADEIVRLRNVVDKEARDFTAEERACWDKVNADYDGLTTQIQFAQRAEQVQKDLAAPANTGTFDPRSIPYDGRKAAKKVWREEKRGRRAEREKRMDARRKELEVRQNKRLGWQRPDITEETRCHALQGWARAQSGRDLKWHHKDACRQTGVNPYRRDLTLNALMRNYQDVRNLYAGRREQRATQALNANVAGGYLVPEGFVQNLEIALLQYSNIRNVADVMRTASGQDLPWPSANDTFNKGAILVENATVGTQTVNFGQTVLHAYKYTSNMVQIPVELLEDSAFNLAAQLGQLLGIRIARIQNDHMTTGTGIAQPTGITIAATQGVAAASATAIAWDDMYKLKHAVDPAYRAPGMNASWMFHDTIFGFLKRLKDGAGRYLWQSGVSASAPDTIDGDPYTINQSMASTMATGNKTVLYGAMSKYKVRDVTQIRLRRLVERFADSDQEAFVMFARFDSTLLDAGTHPVQYLVH